MLSIPSHRGRGSMLSRRRFVTGTAATAAFAGFGISPFRAHAALPLGNDRVLSGTQFDLTVDETRDVAELTQQAMRVLRRVSNPAGFNLGMNQGAVAGAGIAGHLHQHIVPRWGGDMNFLPVIAQTRALPQLLGDARQQLADAWNS